MESRAKNGQAQYSTKFDRLCANCGNTLGKHDAEKPHANDDMSRGPECSGFKLSKTEGKIDKASRGTKYIVVSGKDVTDHPSKKDAHQYAKALRSQGHEAFAHPAAFAKQFGLDPRDQPRDALGKWASSKLS